VFDIQTLEVYILFSYNKNTNNQNFFILNLADYLHSPFKVVCEPIVFLIHVVLGYLYIFVLVYK